MVSFCLSSSIIHVHVNGISFPNAEPGLFLSDIHQTNADDEQEKWSHLH